MAVLKRPDGEIHYQTYGDGFPVLLFAPGGLRSRMEMWPDAADGTPRSWVDWTKALPAAGFTAIAMDQRNAGASRCDIKADHGWHTYAADHLALMDHLGFERFHVLGGCIGGSFCLKAVETAPKRVVSAVLQNPIGLHPEHTDYFPVQSCRVDQGAAGGAADVWTQRRSPRSGATCGVVISSSASAGISCAPVRCRPSCCLAPISRTQRRPARNWRRCCRASRC